MIAVNQVGYESKGIKHATIVASQHYQLFRTDGTLVREGDTDALRPDENSGESAALIDFSDVSEPGEYYFREDNGEESCRFKIAPNIKELYDPLLTDALRMLYFQRCGMELEEKYAGKFKHKACHCQDAYYLGDPEHKRKLIGGWHDAGDYGRYSTAASVALAHMFYSYLLNPDIYKKLDMNIPESGNGTPDILNECRYELDWLLQMQDADGGVHHKATSKTFLGFLMPEEDLLEIIITPVSSLATADFAAVTALASRVWNDIDPDYAEKCRKAALLAGEWLEKNPSMLFENPREVTTGTYEDLCDADERFWAAIELYQITKDEKYIGIVRQIMELRINTTALGWADVGGFATLSLLISAPESFDPLLLGRLRGSWIDEAERLLAIAEGNDYEITMHPYNFIWGSNMIVLCNAMNLCVAHKISGNTKYLEAARRQLDYILGRNAVNTSYVTGYGERAFRNPHNRPTIADGIDDPIPGFVSGGPNAFANDTVANPEKMKGAAPMKWFADAGLSYCTNEITIYWNSPLIFILGYFLSL